MSDRPDPSENEGYDTAMKYPETVTRRQDTDNYPAGPVESREVDLLELSNRVLSYWKKVLIIAAVFTGLVMAHFLFGPNEYRSEAILIQESEGGQGTTGNELLQRLSGNIGLLGGGSSIMSTARGYSPPPIFLYPSIVNSSEFQYELIYRDIEFSEMDSTMTLFEYFTDYYQPPFRDRVYDFAVDMTFKLPLTAYRGVRNLFRSRENDEVELNEETVSQFDDRLLSATEDELGVIEILRQRITIEFEPGLTRVSATLPDPKAAALMNVYLIERIQEYMTNYRIEKARQNLQFVREQHQDAKKRYEEAQMELARFQDQNVNLTSATAQTQLEHLQGQRDLRFNVYNSLSEQVEQARLTLQEQTPVFNVLEKPNIPTAPYTGLSEIIMIFTVVFGLFLGIGWVLISDAYRRKKQEVERQSSQ